MTNDGMTKPQWRCFFLTGLTGWGITVSVFWLSDAWRRRRSPEIARDPFDCAPQSLRFAQDDTFFEGRSVAAQRTPCARQKFFPSRAPGFEFLKMVGLARFELATPCTRGKCATKLRYSPTDCGDTMRAWKSNARKSTEGQGQAWARLGEGGCTPDSAATSNAPSRASWISCAASSRVSPCAMMPGHSTTWAT